MGWTRVIIKNTDSFRSIKVRRQFESVFISTLSPKDAAMFIQKANWKETVLYFSPKATEIFVPFLNSLFPTQCEAPLRSSVSLLVGHATAFNLLTQDDAATIQPRSPGQNQSQAAI